MLGMYILVDKVPVKEPDTIKWGEWMQDIENRRVAETFIEGHRISTVFLGLDHGIFDAFPLLFETMIFGPTTYDGEYQERCCTWEQAEKMHTKAVKWLLENVNS